MEEPTSTAAPKSKTRTPDTPKQRADRERKLLEANNRARVMFAERYEGAQLMMQTKLYNRTVIRQFSKSFDICQRNWHIATSVPRSTLGDQGMAAAIEQKMLDKVNEGIAFVRSQIKQCEAIAQDDAEVDFKAIVHGAHFDQAVRVIGPVGVQLRNLYLLADQVCDYASALHAFGSISSDEANKITYDVKKRLTSTASAIRNLRVGVLERVNEAGMGRPGYAIIETEDEGADYHAKDTDTNAAASASAEVAPKELQRAAA